MREIVSFVGHKLIRAEHKTTIEITKEDFLTSRGDCIIGVNSSKSASELDERLKKYIREGREINFTLYVEGERYCFNARGGRNLTMSSRVSIVIRKSRFVDERTVAVMSEAAASDIPRKIIDKLRAGGKGEIVIEVH
jgi:hypothetical protein